MIPHSAAPAKLVAGMTLTLLIATAAAVIPGKAQNTGVIEINGGSESIQLRLENVPVAMVLGELSRRFNVTYGPSVAATTRQLSGRYSGTLNQVLARILDGNDYILESIDQRVNIVILNASNVGQPGGAKPVASATTGQSSSAPAPVPEIAHPMSDPADAATTQVPPLSGFLSR